MFDDLVTALKATGIQFAEYAWDQRPKVNYGTVAIDGAGESLAADNRIENQPIEGTIDLYTYDNDREGVELIQGVLNDMEGCAWYLESVQYENDSRMIHWEWIFQLEGL